MTTEHLIFGFENKELDFFQFNFNLHLNSQQCLVVPAFDSVDLERTAKIKKHALIT